MHRDDAPRLRYRARHGCGCSLPHLSTVVADRSAPPLSRSLRRSLYISNERFITRTVSIRSECA